MHHFDLFSNFSPLDFLSSYIYTHTHTCTRNCDVTFLLQNSLHWKGGMGVNELVYLRTLTVPDTPIIKNLTLLDIDA